jgi:serine/threonine protein kinase
MPGQQIGRFEILSELGQGGLGAVYLAYDSQLDRQVAI